MRRVGLLVLFIILLTSLIIVLKSTMTTQDNNHPASQRIISLSPAITEMLFSLDLADRVVGVTDYCDYPIQAQNLPKVGGFINPNLEIILALQPDVVILLNNQTKTIKHLQQLNIKTLALKNSRLDDIKHSISLIGDYTQHQDQALKIVSNMDKEINRIKQKVAGLPRPKVMVTIGHSMASEQIEQIYIAGQHDFYNDLISISGGRNAYTGQSLSVPSVSIEGIMQLNPEVILDVFPEADDHQTDLVAAKKHWQSLKYIDAIQNDQVHIIEENYATIP
ncbi:MAG: ABC transporter substrate-binding protein, partial [Gammaproteobacteria bacterium]